MTNEDLTGRIVMVHPELLDDPAEKMGEMGTITAADIAEDLVRVKFDDDRRGLYATNALLVFKPSDEIYQHLKQDVMILSPDVFKDLKAIALLLDYKRTDFQQKAMEIAQHNTQVITYAMVSLEDSLGLNQSYKRGR